MFASKKILVASLLLSAAVVGAKTAQAEGHRFNGGSGNGGNGKSSFKINWGTNTSSQNQHKNSSLYNTNKHHNNHNYKKNSSCHHDNYYPGHYHVKYVQPRFVYSKCYSPDFRCCYVLPGDTWYTISKRVYGVDYMCKHIASFNGLTMGSPLAPGQMLQLPVINANGSLAASTAPMPQPYLPPGGPFGPQASMIGPQGVPNGLPQSLPGNGLPPGAANGFIPQSVPNGLGGGPMGPRGATIIPTGAQVMPNGPPSSPTMPTASIRTISDPAITRVAIGSTLELDGKLLGSKRGSVRLEIDSLVLPVDVIEWMPGSVKVQLPNIELSRSVRATLQVLRADGSVASRSAIELTPAATRVALSN